MLDLHILCNGIIACLDLLYPDHLIIEGVLFLKQNYKLLDMDCTIFILFFLLSSSPINPASTI